MDRFGGPVLRREAGKHKHAAPNDGLRQVLAKDVPELSRGLARCPVGHADSRSLWVMVAKQAQVCTY